MTWLTDLILAAIVFLGRHPAIPMVVAIVLPIAAAIVLPTPSGKPFSKVARLSMLIAFLLVVANLWIGDRIANRLIYLGGVDGQAIVTSTRTLNETYNYHDVVGYDMVLQTADGRSVKTTTKSDEFNIYPSGTRVSSSDAGYFKVRYLTHIPSLFIIIAD